ncbi:Proliferating cell nuclear antigen [Tetrabaena socialis]|uniref:DNA sliding clamp PCNA n=1 Tax=Tetrabaena socialis TaxID=47790 RepID=A0A2J8AJ22_9CHLO|nr:Proliferating cell nuclear antigen [Tetrabaena socialis]|eukprot:PNH12519.1 Proliferating cell nuclear antigen [Tetrabaena socialis]
MFTFASAKQLRSLVEALGEILQEVNIDATSDGIYVQSMDPSHVCLVSLALPSSDQAMFDKYACQDATCATLGVNIPNLIRVMKCSGPDDRALLTTEGDIMSVRFTSTEDAGAARSADFELKLMLIDTDRMVVPDSGNTVDFRMASTLFSKAMKDFASLGDSVMFEVQELEDMLQLTMSCEGSIGRGSMRFKSARSTTLTHDATLTHVNTGYSLKHLVSMTRACCLAEEVTLKFEENMPLCIEFNITSSGSVLRYYLAPKLPDEDGGDEGCEAEQQDSNL